MSRHWLSPSIALLVSLSFFGEYSYAYTQPEQLDTLRFVPNLQLAKKIPIRRGPQIRNPRNVIDIVSNLRRRVWNSSPKHKPGGWGTKMDLDDQAAQTVLNQGIPFGSRVYGYRNRKFYRFEIERIDNDKNGYFHGYPVEINGVPPKVQQGMRKLGILK